MLQLRPFESLGHANHGWLDAHHHFSFAEYYDCLLYTSPSPRD